MKLISYVTSFLAVLFLTACSAAIPTVTNLSTPIRQSGPAAGTISSGGGIMNSTNFKIDGKINPTGNDTMVGTNFKIKTNGE